MLLLLLLLLLFESSSESPAHHHQIKLVSFRLLNPTTVRIDCYQQHCVASVHFVSVRFRWLCYLMNATGSSLVFPGRRASLFCLCLCHAHITWSFRRRRLAFNSLKRHQFLDVENALCRKKSCARLAMFVIPSPVVYAKKKEGRKEGTNERTNCNALKTTSL